MNVTAPSDESLLELLADLVRINSVNPNYEGGVTEAAMADFVEQYFQRIGVETWRQIVYPDRPNVIARIPGLDPSRRIVFEAHLDTVSTVGMTIPPWTPDIRDGKMYGRGACDTKGGMAAMMHALASLVHQGYTPACDVLFAATIDEEYSYRGVVALCDSLDPGPVDPIILETEVPPRNPLRAEAAIIAEPTGLEAVIASKGLVRWKIETRGKAAHSAKPHLGNNAIEQMAHVIRAIEADNLRLAKLAHPLLGPATCNIGVIRGGVQINFVPDRCEIEIDRRLLPGETREGVLAEYQQLLDRLAADHPAMDAVMHPPMLSDRPLETDVNSAAVKTLRQVLESLGHPAEPIGVPFCSDASKFGALGIPSMILGPGSIDQAHAAVEFIECEQVIACAEIYRQFVLQFK
ncbi:putative succinyl-diaminopimelate desuccinylase [Roseimaritima multifibrata]|uniref:Probable succinyl-diaminopimelate desuccinylase n=1 Tax=Roseimaritima multifibrata TaxID=1930274 RepID=A0A517MAQ8_9BACT|nr:M20 family metallopeptidase [Roseimaritima multifibrata]QDS91970.1 putative succinyl-diaminopimelate desuccinylase [Roseimaritima multifibrata]